jgi:hypothetical protein
LCGICAAVVHLAAGFALPLSIWLQDLAPVSAITLSGSGLCSVLGYVEFELLSISPGDFALPLPIWLRDLRCHYLSGWETCAAIIYLSAGLVLPLAKWLGDFALPLSKWLGDLRCHSLSRRETYAAIT